MRTVSVLLEIVLDVKAARYVRESRCVMESALKNQVCYINPQWVNYIKVIFECINIATILSSFFFVKPEKINSAQVTMTAPWEKIAAIITILFLQPASRHQIHHVQIHVQHHQILHVLQAGPR